MKRLLLPAFLLSILASGNPLFPPPPPLPLFQPQAGFVTLDLGGGLIWQGPQITQEEWDQRMALLPAGAPLIPLLDSPLQPALVSLQAQSEPTTATPEPSSITLIGLGLLAGVLLLRSRTLHS